MAGRRFTYLCALAGCWVFYLAYQGWFSWLLLVGMLWLPWFSLALSLPGIFSFRIKAEGPGWLPMGTSGTLEPVGTGRFPVPPFTARVQLRHIPTGTVFRGTAIPGDHCGGIEVTVQRVRVCDYLGLFRFPVRKAQNTTVLVRPRPIKMAAPIELERYLAYSWKPKPGGGYAENHELRLYRPGDSLNQVHWKLTAKTGKLMIREPMEPIRGKLLVTVDICGTMEELDRKFGRLLWLGDYLLEKKLPFEIRAMTESGIAAFSVADEYRLKKAVDSLLCCGPCGDASARDLEEGAFWHMHIGGEPDET